MKLKDLLYLMCDSDQLFCMEDKAGNCLYCGEVDKVDLRRVYGYEVVKFYPERYGAYYNRTGITFVVKEEAHAD